MKCVVKNCKNISHGKTTEKSFFTFPREEKTLQKWLIFCKQAKNFNPKSWRICSDHFNEEDIIGGLKCEMGYGKKKYLKSGAIPCRHAELTRNKGRDERVQRREQKRIVADLLSLDFPKSISSNEVALASNSSNVVDFPSTVPNNECGERSSSQHNSDFLKVYATSSSAFSNENTNNFSIVNSPQSSYSNDSPVLENTNEKKVVNLEFKLKIVEKKLKMVEKEKENLEEILWQKDKKNEFEIDVLKREVAKLKFEFTNVEEKLKGIFTDGQIKKLKNGEKKQNWSQNDIANSINLYSASAKCYRLLKKKNFPLPAIHTLQSWAQKIEIKPGLLKPVLKLLSETRHLTEKQKLCVLSFDETKLREAFCYDRISDTTLPPSKNVQVGMLRGLIAKWKQPIYYEFDKKMTSDVVENILRETKNCGYNVVAVVSDLGGSNRGLFKILNVTAENPWFTFDGERVYVFADVPHLIKLLRNHFLDEGFMIDGLEVKKDIIYDLLQCTSGVLSITNKISARHLEVKGTERQKVKMATKLFSHTVAQAVTRAASLGHLSNKNWEQCHKLLKITNDWFDVMNVKVPNKDSRERAHAYGIALEVQNKILDDMSEMIENMRAIGRTTLLPFQKGILQSNKALKLLLGDVKRRFQIDYILTYRLNQDVLENFFGVIRAKGGMHDHPDQQEFKYRLRAYLLGRNEGLLSDNANIEADDTPDLEGSALPLTGVILSSICTKSAPNQNANDDVEEVDELEYDAVENIAGYICHKLKTEFPTISVEPIENKSYTWVDHLSEGGLSKPSSELVSKIIDLETIFKNVNGDSLYICTGYQKRLLSKSQNIDCQLKIKKLFFRSRMYFTIRKLNSVIQTNASQKKRKMNKIKT